MTPVDRPRRCAVLGSPIAHSLSPALHLAAYADLGLDWGYQAIEVTADGLPDFLRTRDEHWRGLSLTMPLKRAVLPLLDHADAQVQRSGVANTVVLEGGRRWGHNTDVPGAVAALRERISGEIATVTVLGGGATATSLALAVADLGATHLTIAARDPRKARATGEEVLAPLPVQVDWVLLEEAPQADLVVSTVPSGALAEPGHGALLERLAAAPAVFDVVYDPWPTALSRAAQGIVVSGLDLLVHQANLQVQLFTGTRRDLVEVMRRAGEAALAQRHG
jgi:shikimate dehydrogenase